MNFETGYSMLIDGALVTGDAQIEVTNPANGQIFATAPDCAPDLRGNQAALCSRQHL